jgi:23S rRNA (cytosine1962-C5)-methyltransferase
VSYLGRKQGARQNARPAARKAPQGSGAALVLKNGRERSLERRHPWIFSGAVESVAGAPAAGDTVRLEAADGRFLGWAAYSPHSQIRARVWSFFEAELPDEAWLERKLAEAIGRRGGIAAGEARRLVHAESDGLPGLIVDRYADLLVLQFLSAGAELRRQAIVDSLASLTGSARMFERSDAEVRVLEGLSERTGPLLGDVPQGPVEIAENGLRYLVDVCGGQKTGFYLDQRDNRARVRELSAGREVLNCFAYTGGFAVAALAGGARSVLSVDSSGPALALGRDNARLNGFEQAQWLEADVFATLRSLRDAARSFDLIVLDPPKFAPTQRQAQAAARGYKDINLNALRLLRPGGLLATFSCSGGVSAELFQKIVAGAAADAGVSATIQQRFQAAADHPVMLEFPEGEYLKGLLLRREA